MDIDKQTRVWLKRRLRKSSWSYGIRYLASPPGLMREIGVWQEI